MLYVPFSQAGRAALKQPSSYIYQTLVFYSRHLFEVIVQANFLR